MNDQDLQPKIYQNHNSGKLYRQICIANSTATKFNWRPKMVYQDMRTMETWSRDLREFLALNSEVDAPKKDKGFRGGRCNLTNCANPSEPALWFNHGSLSYYCTACAECLNTDEFNKADALARYGHKLCTVEVVDCAPCDGVSWLGAQAS